MTAAVIFCRNISAYTDESFYSQDYLHGCLMQIEDMVTATINARVQSQAAPVQTKEVSSGSARSGTQSQEIVPAGAISSAASDKVMEHEKAGTPTDVRDVHFWRRSQL